MKIEKYLLPKELFFFMSKEMTVFIILLSNFLNEISVLYKCIRIKPKALNTNTPEATAEFCFLLMFIKLMASKLYEGWRLITKLNKNLSIELNGILSDKSKKMKKEINRYFKKGSNLEKIRNYFGFHYEHEKGIVEKGLEQLAAIKGSTLNGLTFFLSECHENRLFAFSDFIILEALKKEIVCRDGENFFETFCRDTSRMCDLLHEFAMNCLLEIAAAKNIHLEPVEEINISNPPSYNDINFPFFIRREEEE